MHVYDWNSMRPQVVTELYRRTVAQGEKMSVARLEVAKGSATMAHRHEHEEVIILLQGCWQFHFTTGDVVLRPNQMLTITPGMEHSSDVLEDVVAIDVCSPTREDWLNGADRTLHDDPDQCLWGV
jgi:mannose-6-phosphate isomerase-like protein (cupin superfamily)